MADLLDLTASGPGMVYVGETPWHKLGKRVDGLGNNVQDWVREARLGWQVAAESISRIGYNPSTGSTIQRDPGKRSILIRTDTGAILDIVGPRFQITQNAEALGFLQAFCDANAATLETVGALDGGRYVWGLARMNRTWIAGQLRNGKPDIMADYLLVMLPHMQAKAIIVKYIQTRVVCWNTLSLGLQENGHEYRLTHTKRFDAVARGEAQRVMGLAVEASDGLQATVRGLVSKSFSHSDLDAFLCRLVQASDEQARAILDGPDSEMPLLARRIVDANQTAPGAMPGTAWGVLNAVTYVVDHARKNVEASAKSGVLGTGADLKARALELLTA